MNIPKLLLAAALGYAAHAVAADTDAAWKAKQIPEWTEDDAKEVLAESGWVKTFTPTIKQEGQRKRDAIGIGIPGLGGIGGGGGGRRGMGGGYPGGGGGYPGGGRSRAPQQSDDAEPRKVTLRWESAMPVRTAELKTHDNDAPTLDGNHYAIAVYGVPDRLLESDSKKQADQLKKEAAIKRDGKKDLKPSSVEILQRPDGNVVVYLFPMTGEISKQDHRLEFDAQIGRMELTQSFFTEDMVFQGKLEL